MSYDGWPSSKNYARAKTVEVAKIAGLLGHKLTGWLEKGPSWLSRCVKCNDDVRIENGGLGPEVKGPAAVFRCKKT